MVVFPILPAVVLYVLKDTSITEHNKIISVGLTIYLAAGALYVAKKWKLLEKKDDENK